MKERRSNKFGHFRFSFDLFYSSAFERFSFDYRFEEIEQNYGSLHMNMEGEKTGEDEDEEEEKVSMPTPADAGA